MSGNRYPAALSTIVRGSAVPYGYTLTIWATGTALERRHGSPGAVAELLFAAGAVAAFAALALVVRRLGPTGANQPQRALIVTGIVQILAVGIALAAATFVSHLPGPAAWPLGAFAATLMYLLVAALELLVASDGDGAER